MSRGNYLFLSYMYKYTHTTRDSQDYFRTLLYSMGSRISQYLTSELDNTVLEKDDITEITLCGERVGRVVPTATDLISEESPASGVAPPTSGVAPPIDHDKGRCQHIQEKEQHEEEEQHEEDEVYVAFVMR